MNRSPNLFDEEKMRKAEKQANKILQQIADEKEDPTLTLEDAGNGAVQTAPMTKRYKKRIKRILEIFDMEEGRTCDADLPKDFYDIVRELFRDGDLRRDKLHEFTGSLSYEIEQQTNENIARFASVKIKPLLRFLTENPEVFTKEVQKYLIDDRSTDDYEELQLDGDEGEQFDAFTMMLLDTPELGSRMHPITIRRILRNDEKMLKKLIDVCGANFNDSLQEKILKKINKFESDAESAKAPGSLHALFLERIGEKNLCKEARKILFELGLSVSPPDDLG